MFGAYPLLGELGRGGFGEVFLSEDPWSGQRVALKRAGPRDGASERLMLEFGLHASLCTPILPEPGRLGRLPDGQIYATMERLRGRGVMATARRAGAPRSFARQQATREIVAGLLASLAGLHDLGVLHCDLKTRNLYLHPSGAVRLLDLGAARRLDPGTGLADGEHFMGTPRYASPEQRDRQALDVRADLFSVGALALRLITDEKPEWPPTPPAGLEPSLSDFLSALVALDPSQRPASARAALALLGPQHTVSAAWWTGSAVVYVAPEEGAREQRARALCEGGAGLTIQARGETIGTAMAPLWATEEPATLIVRELHRAGPESRNALARLLRRSMRQGRRLHLRATAAPDPDLRDSLALARFCPVPRPERLSAARILEATVAARWDEALRMARGADPLLPDEQPVVRAAAACWAAMGQHGEARRLVRELPLDQQTPLPDLRPPALAAAIDGRDLVAAMLWLHESRLDAAPEACGGALLALSGQGAYSSSALAPPLVARPAAETEAGTTSPAVIGSST